MKTRDFSSPPILAAPSTDMADRGRRIADKKRVKERAARIGKLLSSTRFFDADDWAKRAEHMAKCSCWMCGNPRRHFGEVTMKEKKEKQREDSWD